MDPQAQRAEEDECPVCHNPLPRDPDASETHIATCIENQLFHVEDNKKKVAIVPSKGAQLFNVQDRPGDSGMSSSEASMNAPAEIREEDRCPVCSTLLSSKGIGDSEAARAAHVMACVDALESQPSGSVANEAKANDVAPPYGNSLSIKGALPQSSSNSLGLFSRSAASLSQVSDNKGAMGTSSSKEDRKGGLRGLLSSLGGDAKSKEQKAHERITRASELMQQRWGPPGSPVYEMVMRYMKATRMTAYWEMLGEQHPREFAKYLNKGYMEPIPTAWVQTRQLAYQYPEGSYWETPAEKRLYYLLNNGVMPDGSRHEYMRPLNINRDRNTIIRRGNARNARQQRIDANKLAAYRSPGDVFHNDKQIHSHEYSPQVSNVVYEARTRALHELADGLMHGTDHLETMLLIDVSGSMTWNPHRGVIGPDGIRRYHDQPSNIALVQHLVHRVLHHMIPRAQKEHPTCIGIDTVTFSTYGHYVGQLSAANFTRDWYSKVRLGGGTQVMQGWQVVKQSYFQHQNSAYGHGRYDPMYGWQATPGMPKLSLLVFLDGEATDMDEFELELLGETWAYVTIVLVGMENCPHHHSHAVELERVARFNPHVGFFDVHGRVCERLVVEDILGSVYPVDPPGYSEILKPEYDLPADELPAYTA